MTGGTWDDNGSYTVTEDIVPGVGDKANEGYKAGDWDRTPIDAIITKQPVQRSVHLLIPIQKTKHKQKKSVTQ